MQTETLANASYRKVRLSELTTDGRFNRSVTESGVARILSDFQPRAFGALVLWQREDAQLVILDGQHRVEAARRFGIPEEAKCLPAMVLAGLSLSEAAELFVQLNDSRLVSAYDKFYALRTAGHLQTIAIDQIVRINELAVDRSPRDGCISCVDALRKTYCLGEPEGAVLGLTLATLRLAWGALSEAYRSPILRGIGLYFHEHRDTAADALADALVRGPGAPINLIGWAKTIAGTQQMSLDHAIAEVIQSRVMKKRPARKTA